MSSKQQVIDFLAQLVFSEDLKKSSEADGIQELPDTNHYKTPTEFTIEKLCGQYRAVENEARKIIRDHQKSIMEKKDNLQLYPSKLPNLESIGMTVGTKIDSWDIQNKSKYQEAFLQKKKYATATTSPVPQLKAKSKPKGWPNFIAIAAGVTAIEAFLNAFILREGLEPSTALLLSLFFSLIVIVPTLIIGGVHKRSTGRSKRYYLYLAVAWTAYVNLLIALVRTDIINKLPNAADGVIKANDIVFEWGKALNPSSFLDIKGIDPYLLIFFGVGSAVWVWIKIQSEVQTDEEEIHQYGNQHVQKFVILEREIKEAFNKILMDLEPNFKQCGEDIKEYIEDIRASKELISNEEDNLAYLIEGTRTNYKLMISECRNINMIYRATHSPEEWKNQDIDDTWIELNPITHIEVNMRELVDLVNDHNSKIVQLEVIWSGMKNVHNKELDKTLSNWAEEANSKIE